MAGLFQGAEISMFKKMLSKYLSSEHNGNGRIASIILFEMEKGDRERQTTGQQQQSWLVLQEFTTLFCLPSQIFCKERVSLSLSLCWKCGALKPPGIAMKGETRGRDMTGEMGFEFYSEVKLLKSYFGTNCAVIVAAEGGRGENKGRNFCNMTDEARGKEGDCSFLLCLSANYFCSTSILFPFPSLLLSIQLIY